MASIRTLEIAFGKEIKNILRDFMGRIDYSNFDDSFDDGMHYFHTLAANKIERIITKTYRAGYSDANILIKQGMRSAAVVDKTTLLLMITKSLTDKLKDLTENQKDEMQEKLIQHQAEQFTYQQIADDMLTFFDYDTAVANRFARTASNYVYNAAHLNRYRDTGIVPGVRYAAHIDNVTSEICIMLNGTIWAVDDPNIRTPPNHFNCCLGNTRITTEYSEKNIDDVQVGDMVLTHKMRCRPVIATMARTTPRIYKLCTSNRTIHITGEHPILRSNALDKYNTWVQVCKLNTNDLISVIDDNKTSTEMINNIEIIENRWLEVVYNLSVLDDESYVANGIISHNCRSRILPYFGGIPGERDYKKDFEPEFIAVAEETLETFHTKYWDVYQS